MVEIELTAESLIVHVRGLDKLWAAKSSLAIPLSHIAGVELGVSSEAERMLQSSLRVGTHMPHVITAGRFYSEGKIAFWDVHSGEHAITIRVVHDDYTHLVVEVADPKITTEQILAHLAGPIAPLPKATLIHG